ncbi:Pol Polyprotein [Phytophthora megakarya]|uniref:Pol Polyprotein n=1 Tax=Phytophthora megakarya TaxID=4795 RepID=A0A225WQ55_9STRA|nr:Pol Polyprotein [Phytophthora megakarya]
MAPHDCSEQVYTLVNGVTGEVDGNISSATLPSCNALLGLDEMSLTEFGDALKAGDISEVVMIRPEEQIYSPSVVDDAVLEDTKKALNERSGSEIIHNRSDPFHSLLAEYGDVVSKTPPMRLPSDRGVRHEIYLVPGTKYCVTRQWPLPKEQYDVIDAFFRDKHEAGLVRESQSPHSTPTFCARKPNGKWRIVHAFNKLNAATIPAQTQSLAKMSYRTTWLSPIDLVDLYYQLLIRASDIPLTAVSTPRDMLWEWLVMPQELSNAPATCFEPIPFLGCFIGKRGLRADPAKIKAIVDWPVPVNLKDLRKWFGLVNYLHKYSENYADMARPLSNVLKKDMSWCWDTDQQAAFEAIKVSLLHAPILALPDPDRPFSVFCDASEFAIGCALL